MKIVIVCPNGPPNYGLEVFMANAFKALGHSVEMFAIIESNKTLLNLNQRIRVKLKKIIPSVNVSWLERKNLSKKILLYKPDLTIVLRGDNLGYKTIRSFRKNSRLGCINIYPDSPFAIPGVGAPFLWKSLNEYSRLFTFSPSLIPVFYQLGCTKVSSLPFGYCPSIHHSVPYNNDYVCDVAYLGAWGPIQERVLKPIASNYSLKIYGPGWNKSEIATKTKSFMSGCGMGQDMAYAINSASLILNFVRSEHGCFHTMKTFEIPACGGLVLSNYTDEQNSFFKSDKEAFYFSNYDEILPKIKMILSDKNLRESVRLQGKKSSEKHSYETRAKEILEIVKHDN